MNPPPAIHSTAVVAPDVEVGAGTVIGPYAVVIGPCRIGDGCWIGPHCVIGTTAEDVSSMVVPEVPTRPLDADALDAAMWFCGMGEGVEIGDRTIVREMTTIQQGTRRPTAIGSDVFLMDKSHVAHDNVIGDRVTISNFVGLAGHVTVGDDATIGLNASVHQWRVVGAGAMVGMQSAVTRDVRPFELVKGVPARPSGLNRVRLRRLGVDDTDSEALGAHYAGSAPEPPARFAGHLATFEAQRRWRP